jgi:hypothetical protein
MSMPGVKILADRPPSVLAHHDFCTDNQAFRAIAPVQVTAVGVWQQK